MKKITWPDGKKFAFTIFDDTDDSTYENVSPVYNFLDESGFLTTKSIWPIKCENFPSWAGATCEDTDYLNWVLGLRSKGFEIGYHGASALTSKRADTKRALDKFYQYFDHYPTTMANHSDCHENIYWGRYRLGKLFRIIYDLVNFKEDKNKFSGHIEDSPLFWGDLCRDKIKYVRNFVYNEINTLKVCPEMPYHDPSKPYVQHWFAGSDGQLVDQFNIMLREKNQDKLENEGGACIMYTHFGCGFYKDGKLNNRFKKLMTRLSKKNGWFVPVGVLLDYLKDKHKNDVISNRRLYYLELKWLKDKLFLGHS